MSPAGWWISGPAIGSAPAPMTSQAFIAAATNSACHTFSHTRAIDLDAAAMAAEMEKNRRYSVGARLFDQDREFRVSVWTGIGVAQAAARQSLPFIPRHLPGVNSGTVDLQFLRATPLIEPQADRDGVDRAFDEAVASNGWLIFYSHDVATTPSPFGCSPALLRHALEAASRRKVPILSITEALRRIGA